GLPRDSDMGQFAGVCADAIAGQARSHADLPPRTDLPLHADLPLRADLPLEDAERSVLLAVLELNRWHLTNVASHLGISRNTLYRKLRKHGIARAG
ncbi:helix-turn-helix domain-containing protein, partial [Pseudomonas sp.]|uniref:helix-turn-helix domain-containing protein n=1 Tax=Pseudomonas sp. TaxID=306 RepID=UPI0028A055B9